MTLKGEMEKQIKELADDKLTIAQIITSEYPGDEVSSVLTSEGIRINPCGYTWLQINNLLEVELSSRGYILSADSCGQYSWSKKDQDAK